MAEFKFEIKKELGVLSSSQSAWSKEVNLVSWNGGEAKLDIREWSPDHSRMGKGVSFTPEEVTKLKEILANL